MRTRNGRRSEEKKVLESVFAVSWWRIGSTWVKHEWKSGDNMIYDCDLFLILFGEFCTRCGVVI